MLQCCFLVSRSDFLSGQPSVAPNKLGLARLFGVRVCTLEQACGSCSHAVLHPVVCAQPFSDQLSRERRNGCWPKALNCYHMLQ